MGILGRIQNREETIKPERITKPFQLLATWLFGLVILVGEFIFASLQSYPIKWLNALYGISAITIIPIFLRLIFLLQTKYRPEMQEDKYYCEHLRHKYIKEIREDRRRVDYLTIKREE